MRVQVLASGSKGNCYVIQGKKDKLLLECGITFKKIKQGLNFDLSNIVGCLITHEHKDHCKSIGEVVRAGIDVYTARETADVLGVDSYRLKPVQPKQQCQIGEFKVLFFDTEHDAVNPLGFLIQDGTGEKLLFVTDSYYCKYKFTGVNYMMVECNYDENIINQNLEEGRLYKSHYNRLLKSHMSFESCKEFLRANDLSNCKEIYLLHTSDRNSDPDVFREEIQEMTGIKTIVGGK